MHQRNLFGQHLAWQLRRVPQFEFPPVTIKRLNAELVAMLCRLV